MRYGDGQLQKFVCIQFRDYAQIEKFDAREIYTCFTVSTNVVSDTKTSSLFDMLCRTAMCFMVTAIGIKPLTGVPFTL